MWTKIQMSDYLSKSEIKQVVIDAFEHYQSVKHDKIQFPVPIKAIAKCYDNVKVVPYSTHMKYFNLTYKEMVKQCKTEDAYTDYDANNDLYVIYYNDISSSKVRSNRYRWNIAHELGHVLLLHHTKFEHTKLYRNDLSKSEYNALENEADLFASYILAPYLPLYFLGISSKLSLQRTCKISSPAAYNRYNGYLLWRRKSDNTNPKNNKFEYALWELFFGVVRCNNCESIYRGKKGFLYCKICGEKQLFFSWKGDKMIYSKIEMDDNNKPLLCPRCYNEQLPNIGGFCQICGLSFYNNCSRYSPEDYYSCNNGYHLDGDARYCPYCGSETTYMQQGILKPYTEDYQETVSDYPF